MIVECKIIISELYQDGFINLGALRCNKYKKNLMKTKLNGLKSSPSEEGTVYQNMLW